MSEQKYPTAWGVAVPIVDGWDWEYISDTEEFAEEVASEYQRWRVVELIPRPEVDRLVAEAVAAERERLSKAISPLTVLQDVMRDPQQ